MLSCLACECKRGWSWSILYGFFPSLRGELISVTIRNERLRPGPCDPKQLTMNYWGLETRRGGDLALLQISLLFSLASKVAGPGFGVVGEPHPTSPRFKVYLICNQLKLRIFSNIFYFFLLLIKLPHLYAKCFSGWQCLLMLKCPEYLRGTSIALILWRKLPKNILNGMLRFLHSIVLSWVSRVDATSLLGLVPSQCSLRERCWHQSGYCTKYSDDVQWWKARYPSTEVSFHRFVN